MVLGLTSDFLVFVGTALAMLLMCPVTLAFGYFLVWVMDYIVEKTLGLAGPR